jgi:hypothetical protein
VMYPLTCLSPVSHAGRSEGQSRSCRSGSRASEAVESCSCTVASDRLERAEAQDTVWLKLEYAYSKHHLVLQYLPTRDQAS